MLALFLRFEDGSEQYFRAELPIKIGRCPEADLRIRAWRVGKQHAVLERRPSGIFLDDMGALAGTFVNGERVTQYGPLSADDEIIIGPCLIRLSDSGETTPEDTISSPPVAALTLSEPVPSPEAFEQAVETMLQTSALELCGQPLPAETDELISSHERARHRRRLHSALLETLDLRRRDIASMSDAALRAEAGRLLFSIIEVDSELPPGLDKTQLLNEVVDEAVGLGPLEPLLADSTITEIMVNRYDEIFIESGGRLHRYAGRFSSEQAVMGIIERIVSPLGRRIDESAPMVDARLRDGSRVNAVIPPISLRGASLTIRKFPKKRPTMGDLLRVGALDTHMMRFLEACVIQRKNIIVSGGTGSGKTTLLNILSNCIPSDERIVTIEDAAELQLGHQHLVALEARPANLEGRGAIPIRDLVRNALRMRPDRIVVGECRGAEAFDMLAAMNTGHEGSLTTLHANTPRDALGRLETMILMAGMDLPLTAVREHVASSIDIIVQQARLSSGHRVITSIMQITGQENSRIQLQELFRYHVGPPRAYVGCGVVPENMLLTNGLDITMFQQHMTITDAAAAWQTVH